MEDKMLLQVGSSYEGQEGGKGMLKKMLLRDVVKQRCWDGSRFLRILFVAYQLGGLGD